MEREAAGTAGRIAAIFDEKKLFNQAFREISACKSGFGALVNSLVDGVLILDTEGRVVLANSSFWEMIEYTGEQAIGKLFDEICSSSQIQEMARYSLEEQREGNAELVITREKGSDLVVTLKSQPFANRKNQILGAIIVLHDSTAMAEIDRLKSDFVAMVSHEVRSPMNSLMAQIQIILDGLAGEVTERQREILERVSGKVNNLVRLASELLDLAKIETGILGKEMEDVDMKELLVEQVAFHSPAAAEKGMQVVSRYGQIPAAIWGNRQGLEELFTNLITNAIKYSPADTTLTIDAEQREGYLEVQVIDTGFGMLAEDLAHIFERFYRVKNNNTRNIHGTGLGLAIARSIVEAHQGSIDVKSTPGAGTTFTVRLPIEMESV